MDKSKVRRPLNWLAIVNASDEAIPFAVALRVAFTIDVQSHTSKPKYSIHRIGGDAARSARQSATRQIAALTKATCTAKLAQRRRVQ